MKKCVVRGCCLPARPNAALCLYDAEYRKLCNRLMRATSAGAKAKWLRKRRELTLVGKRAFNDCTVAPVKDARHVYVVRALGTAFVKVGFTCDLERRLTELQTGSPFRLEVEHVRHTTRFRDLEQRLHSRLTPCKMSGEWFLVPPDSQDWPLLFEAGARP